MTVKQTNKVVVSNLKFKNILIEIVISQEIKVYNSRNGAETSECHAAAWLR